MNKPPQPDSRFVPGIELSRRFYQEHVKPLIDREMPDGHYAAALIGPGSEVLGFDDTMSTDHHWGPRLMLFFHDADAKAIAAELDPLFRRELPYVFQGYSVNFGEPNPEDQGVQALVEIDSGEVNHRVEMWGVNDFVRFHLGVDPESELQAAAWLSIPQQKLATFTGGAVYHDEIGLETVRQRFIWYPEDVWLYLMAGSWDLIGEDEHLMGRAGLVGDEIGSALLASRIVREFMRLAFLREKRYPPYPKWFGTSFRQLESSTEMEPYLAEALSAQDWQSREAALVPLYEHAAREQNRLGFGTRVREEVIDFFGRPFRIIGGGSISVSLIEAIEDPAVASLASKRIIGGVDTWTASTSLLSDESRRPVIRSLYNIR